MKKIILICILFVLLLVLSSCRTTSQTTEEKITLILSLDNYYQETCEVDSYIRVSGDYIVIYTKDGRKISTSDKNIILIHGD